MRFVIADDSRIPRDILRRIIMQSGHEVVGVASNGQEAIDLCRSNPPVDAVILDLNMPPFHGNQAAPIIVNERLAKHVIIASSNTQDVLFRPMQDLGCKTIGKPYRTENVGKAIDEISRHE